MRRREFILALGGAATWPRVTRAQQTSVPVVGLLGSGSLQSDAFPRRWSPNSLRFCMR
jgi:putative ABC transport system substrate-binding protein